MRDGSIARSRLLQFLFQSLIKLKPYHDAIRKIIYFIETIFNVNHNANRMNLHQLINKNKIVYRAIILGINVSYLMQTFYHNTYYYLHLKIIIVINIIFRKKTCLKMFIFIAYIFSYRVFQLLRNAEHKSALANVQGNNSRKLARFY